MERLSRRHARDMRIKRLTRKRLRWELSRNPLRQSRMAYRIMRESLGFFRHKYRKECALSIIKHGKS